MTILRQSALGHSVSVSNTHPTRLGRYEVLHELGRGAMGVVYKARDPQIDRLVALKTICSHVEASEIRPYRERFFLEARAAGRLSHPGIVQIFDVGEQSESGDPYIVMELVSGQPLSRMMSNGSKIPTDTALRIAQETAEALGYAHSQGVIHRDIKPANLLITEEGRVKIADFGVAKLDVSSLTLAGSLVGSPAFMAPEQLTGAAVDGRADLFSLGVIVYYLLTGHRPFQGHGATTISFAVIQRQPVPARAFNLELPLEIDYVLSRAMAKDPEARYDNGFVMALDLQDIREHRPPRSCRGTAPNIPAATPSSFVASLLADRSTCSAENGTITRREQASIASATALALTGVDNRASAPHRSVTPGRVPRHAILATAVLVVMAGAWAAARSFIVEPVAPVAPPLRLSAPLDAVPTAPASIATSGHTAGVPVESQVPDTPNNRSHFSAAVHNKARLTPGVSIAAPRASAPPTTSFKDATSATQPQLIRASADAKLATTPRAKLPTAPAGTGDTTPLNVAVKHAFSQATVSLWVDDRLVYAETMRGETKKRLLVFRGVRGAYSTTVQIPVGEHYLRVRVQAEGFDQTQFTTIRGGRQALVVKCDKRNNKLELELQQS